MLDTSLVTFCPQRNGLKHIIPYTSVNYEHRWHFQQYFSYIVAVSLLVEETGVPGENHRPVASH
jgi:hypothetical protein